MRSRSGLYRGMCVAALLLASPARTIAANAAAETAARAMVERFADAWNRADRHAYGAQNTLSPPQPPRR